jgi:hypothetical protein
VNVKVLFLLVYDNASRSDRFISSEMTPRHGVTVSFFLRHYIGSRSDRFISSGTTSRHEVAVSFLIGYDTEIFHVYINNTKQQYKTKVSAGRTLNT